VSVALYIDEHVQSVITHGLRQRGADVLTAQEDGMDGRDDAELLARATALSRVMFTRDRDFLAIAAQWQQTGLPFTGVIYAHLIRVSIGECLRDLELIAYACDPRDYANRVEYLPL
jgi:hypothetical protein